MSNWVKNSQYIQNFRADLTIAIIKAVENNRITLLYDNELITLRYNNDDKLSEIAAIYTEAITNYALEDTERKKKYLKLLNEDNSLNVDVFFEFMPLKN